MDLERRETLAGATGKIRKKRKYLIRDVSPSSPSEPRLASGGDAETTLEETDPRFSKSRRERIAEVAYFKAERRGFQGGDPDRDWYEAEKEVEEWLRRDRPF